MTDLEIRIDRIKEANTLTERILLDMLEAFRDISDSLDRIQDTIENK
jgi:hypothetical protein